MTDHEAVLHDLLLELGVEGVTLWHIKALAALMRGRESRATGHNEGRFFSDLRGEDAVLAEAWALNEEHETYMRNLNDAVRGAAMSLDDSPDQFGGSDYP